MKIISKDTIVFTILFTLLFVSCCFSYSDIKLFSEQQASIYSQNQAAVLQRWSEHYMAVKGEVDAKGYARGWCDGYRATKRLPNETFKLICHNKK